MRLPQIILSVGLLVLVVLLLTPQHHPYRYNTAAETSVHGVIQSVSNFYCPISGGEGTHLTIATDKGTVQVHLATTRFLGGQQWQFSPGEEVEVVGSRVRYQGHEDLIARSIERGGQTMFVRTPEGRPLWAN